MAVIIKAVVRTHSEKSFGEEGDMGRHYGDCTVWKVE